MTNKEFFIDNWKKEMKRTLNAVRALPTDLTTLDYRPDAKSRSAMQIMMHILPHSEQLADAVSTGNIAEADVPFTSTAAMADYYESHTARLVDNIVAIDDNTWESKIVTLEIGGRKIYEASMMNMFWTLLFDTIHHRGQLTTYYRSMGARNPSIYGPSAEDMEERLAAAAAAQN